MRSVGVGEDLPGADWIVRGLDEVSVDALEWLVGGGGPGADDTGAGAEGAPASGTGAPAVAAGVVAGPDGAPVAARVSGATGSARPGSPASG
jgi:hypothetical protein